MSFLTLFSLQIRRNQFLAKKKESKTLSTKYVTTKPNTTSHAQKKQKHKKRPHSVFTSLLSKFQFQIPSPLLIPFDSFTPPFLYPNLKTLILSQKCFSFVEFTSKRTKTAFGFFFWLLFLFLCVRTESLNPQTKHCRNSRVYFKCSEESLFVLLSLSLSLSLSAHKQEQCQRTCFYISLPTLPTSPTSPCPLKWPNSRLE